MPISIASDPLPELAALEAVLDAGARWLQVEQSVSAPPSALPVYAITLGNPAPDAPGIGFFGGVHGLERIGAQVVIAWLANLVARLDWDETLHRQLQCVRLLFMPIVNPGGMQRGTRANPRGVDLMRNAPIDAADRVPALVGGQRISAGLPWYRGRRGEPMELESTALCSRVARELLPRPFALVLDCHSGFGLRDRIWFPYAHCSAPMPHLAELHALSGIFDASHAQHPYVFEPQSHQYLAHGDLWDHLHLRSVEQGGGPFLPLTLEMGSWLWVKKNPRQLFSRAGLFNPLLVHRQDRVLRRHLPLLEFLVRAAIAWRSWTPQGDERDRHHGQALHRWYST